MPKKLLGLASIVWLVSAGCGSEPPVPPHYSGHPFEHWVTESTSPDVKRRKHAIDVIGNVGPMNPGVIPALMKSLEDKDRTVRLAAVLGLSKIGPEAIAAETAVQKLSKDPDEKVRQAATNALDRLHDKR